MSVCSLDQPKLISTQLNTETEKLSLCYNHLEVLSGISLHHDPPSQITEKVSSVWQPSLVWPKEVVQLRTWKDPSHDSPRNNQLQLRYSFWYLVTYLRNLCSKQQKQKQVSSFAFPSEIFPFLPLDRCAIFKCTWTIDLWKVAYYVQFPFCVCSSQNSCFHTTTQ